MRTMLSQTERALLEQRILSLLEDGPHSTKACKGVMAPRYAQDHDYTRALRSLESSGMIERCGKRARVGIVWQLTEWARS